MLFAAMCFDKDDGLETRLANREGHFAHLKGHTDKIVLGGPFMSDDGKNPIGSMLIFDAENLDEVETILQNDPYSKAGLFKSVEIKPWNWTVKNPEG